MYTERVAPVAIRYEKVYCITKTTVLGLMQILLYAKCMNVQGIHRKVFGSTLRRQTTNYAMEPGTRR